MIWILSLFGHKQRQVGRRLSFDEMMNLIEEKKKFRLF